MKTILVLAGFLAVSIASRGDDGKAKERQLYHPPSPLMPSLSIDDQQQLYQYLANILYSQHNRFGWGMIPTATTATKSTATVSTVSTSTISITCTVSTTACDESRRRRHVLSGLLEHQQEEIQPSAVNPVEITPAVSDLLNTREGREADPQLLAYPHHFNPYQGHTQLEPSTSQLARQIPSFLNPVVAMNNAISAFVPPYVANLLPALAAAFPVRQQATRAETVTKVSCTYTFTTFTSSPSCSVPGTLLQCPASTAVRY